LRRGVSWKKASRCCKEEDQKIRRRASRPQTNQGVGLWRRSKELAFSEGRRNLHLYGGKKGLSFFQRGHGREKSSEEAQRREKSDVPPGEKTGGPQEGSRLSDRGRARTLEKEPRSRKKVEPLPMNL